MSDEKGQPEQPEKQPRDFHKKFPTREVTKQFKRLRNLHALLNHPTPKDAYLSLYPNSSEVSAAKNAYRMITPELVEELQRVLSIDPKVTVNKDTLERFLLMMMAQYLKGDIKAGDAIRCVELLTKVVPEFKDRLGVEDLTKLPEEELNTRLRRLGIFGTDAKPN